MIVLHTWTTPNGRKPIIMLEELELEYRIEPVDIGDGAQFKPAFLAISPNNKIPAIVDEDAPGGPLAVFESGAVLTYLAEKTGRLLASEGPARWAALEWLHWQVVGPAPMIGQLGYFGMQAEGEKIPAAVERFTKEVRRLLGVLEGRLTGAPYLAGDGYSIADIAAYTWTAAARERMSPLLGDAFETSPAITGWLERVGARPAVQRAMALKLG